MEQKKEVLRKIILHSEAGTHKNRGRSSPIMMQAHGWSLTWMGMSGVVFSDTMGHSDGVCEFLGVLKSSGTKFDRIDTLIFLRWWAFCFGAFLVSYIGFGVRRGSLSSRIEYLAFCACFERFLELHTTSSRKFSSSC